MNCFECDRWFDPDDDETEICPECEREWLLENVPEAFPNNNNYDANDGTEGSG
jgi:hypothetical protein